MGSTGGMASMANMVQATTSVASAYSQSESIKAKGAYDKQVADTNATLSKFKAQDAISRGATAELQQLKKTDDLVSSQRAAQAASGADVGTGSAAIVRSSSQLMGQTDALTIKNNAWREAWGYTVQANNFKSQGEFAEIATNNEANNTLLTGGLKAVGYGLKAFDRWPRSSNDRWGRGSRFDQQMEQ